MGRDFDVDLRALERFAGDDSFAAHPRGRAGDTRDRPDEIDQRRDVVGPHVEHRTATLGVVEGRIRMPALMARAHEGRRTGYGLADGAFVDELAARLVPPTQEGV